jgi:hypothetical protein
MVRKVIAQDHIGTSLCTTPVKVPCYWVCILCTLAFFGGLFPLWGVSLWFDTDTASVLEDVADDEKPKDHKGCTYPYRELLEMSIVWRIVLGEVSPVDCVEHTCWLK